MVHTGLRGSRRGRAPPFSLPPPAPWHCSRFLRNSAARPGQGQPGDPCPAGPLPKPVRVPPPQRPASLSPPGIRIDLQACAPSRVFKVAKWWEGAPCWTCRPESQAFCPFLSEPAPAPLGCAPPSASGSFHSRRRGACARPRRSRGVRGGRGPRPGITILIASMPFLEGEGLEDPSSLSTKMFNHCVESNHILEKKNLNNKPGTV